MKKMSFYLMVVCTIFLFNAFGASSVMGQNSNINVADNVCPDTSMIKSGGFLETYWNQDFPYNQLCPKDPLNNNSYSYAGCPAVAMGQIIKDVYHKIVVESKCDSLSEVIHKTQGTCPYQCYSISYHPNGYKQSEGILLWDVSPDADSTFENGEWKYYDDKGELVQAINY